MIDFTSQAVELASLVVLVQLFDFGLYGLLIAKLISGTFSVLLAHFTTRVKYSFVYNLAILKEMLGFGFPLQMQYIFSFVFSRIDTVIIGSLLGTSGVALYEIARKIPDAVKQLYTVFISVYFPISANLYATEKKEKTEDLINNSIRILAFITLFGALISVLFGKEIIVLLFSEDYLASYFTFVLLMVGMTLHYFENTLGYSLIAIGDSDKPLIVNIVRSIVSVIGNLILLPKIGFVGAACVSVTSFIIAIPLDAFFLRKKKLHINWIEYFKPLVVFGTLSVLFLISGTSSLLLKIVIAIIYLPACLGLSVFTLKDVFAVTNEAKLTLARILRRILRRPKFEG
jgi:O-antigen/teichoic acid export membrane protein